MGVTSRRVAFGALLMAAVLLPLRRPRTPLVRELGNDQAARYDTLAQVYRTAHLAWTANDLRDSALAVIHGTAPSGPLPVVAWRSFDGATPDGAADSVVRALWQRIGATRSGVRAAVLIYNLRAYRAPGYRGALITDDGSGVSCVAIAPGEIASNGRPSVWQYDLNEALAPCALAAAFGAPGPAVSNWLTATRYAAARSTRWLTDGGAPTAGYAREPWAEWLNSSSAARASSALPRWMMVIGAVDAAAGAIVPYEMGATGLRCIGGNEAACVTGVLHPALRFPALPALPADLTSGNAWPGDSVTVESVRPPDAGFTAALITTFGRERFQRFWSSDRTFEQAFQSAFGESLGHWTARWARSSWANSESARYMSADLALGVPLKASWPVLVVVWTAIGLAIAGAVAQRRTV